MPANSPASVNFVVRSKGERLGRNPKTGVEVPIDPRSVMVFKPSLNLKASMNGITVEGEDQATFVSEFKLQAMDGWIKGASFTASVSVRQAIRS
jgi:hypothetical protein